MVFVAFVMRWLAHFYLLSLLLFFMVNVAIFLFSLVLLFYTSNELLAKVLDTRNTLPVLKKGSIACFGFFTVMATFLS
jgi:hypothetical protein